MRGLAFGRVPTWETRVDGCGPGIRAVACCRASRKPHLSKSSGPRTKSNGPRTKSNGPTSSPPSCANSESIRLQSKIPKMTNMKPRCAIVAAEFARSIVEVMIAEASAEVAAAGGELGRVVRVPGAYEIPIVADSLMARDDVDLLIALGFIERGETQHGAVMGQAVHQTLIDLQLKHHKPVGQGIIGPGATHEQAEKRKVDYAKAAVRAAVRTWKELKELGTRNAERGTAEV